MSVSEREGRLVWEIVNREKQRYSPDVGIHQWPQETKHSQSNPDVALRLRHRQNPVYDSERHEDEGGSEGGRVIEKNSDDGDA